MFETVLYKCEECGEIFCFNKKYDSITKAPCPDCNTCTIKLLEDKRRPISADATAGDIYPEISKYDGR